MSSTEVSEGELLRRSSNPWSRQRSNYSKRQRPIQPEPETLAEGSEEEWSVFADPLNDLKRKINYRHTTKPIIEDLDEIQLDYEEYAATSLSTLSEISFEIPASFNDCSELCISLNKLKAAVTSTISQLQQPGACLLQSQRNILNRLRNELMQVLYTINNKFLDNVHQFVLGYVDRMSRLDVQVFSGFLQCCLCLASDPSRSVELRQLTLRSDKLHELRQNGLINRKILDKRFSDLNVEDLVDAFATLENEWNNSRPMRSFTVYLDLLVVRLAEIVRFPQPAKLWPADLAKYRHLLSKDMASATKMMCEDFCWALMPMYLKDAIYRTLTKRVSTNIPQITKADILRIEETVRANARKNKNSGLTKNYMEAYFKLALRPSEWRKHKRDHPNQSDAGSSVYEFQRSREEKNEIMEALAEVPWALAASKVDRLERQRKNEERNLPQVLVLRRSERDTMILMMIDAYVNNRVGNGISWINTFVHFNYELIRQNDVREYLNRPYPVIVQSYNAFCVYYKGTHFEHRRAAGAFSHWVTIVLQELKGRIDRYNLTSLYTMLPASVSRTTSRLG